VKILVWLRYRIIITLKLFLLIFVKNIITWIYIILKKTPITFLLAWNSWTLTKKSQTFYPISHRKRETERQRTEWERIIFSWNLDYSFDFVNFSSFLTVCWLNYTITHEIRERNGGGITHTPDENMVGSQISAVCAISFELFFSATQELINFSLFNPPSPFLIAVRLCHRIAYSLCVIYFSGST